MKKLLSYLLFGIVAGSFTACSDNNYTSRLKELIIENMTFDHSQSTKTLTYRHEDLSNYECQSSEDWCVATLDASNSKLTVSVKANESYDSRTATITLADKNDATKRAFTVTQERTDGLFIDETSFEVSMEGGSVTVTLKSNVDYEVVIPSDCDWVTKAADEAKSRGLEESSFTLNVEENKSYKERTAIITVKNKDNNMSGRVTIHQSFEAILNADSQSFNVEMEGGTVMINTESNIAYDVIIPKDCNWVTIDKSSKTKATSTSTITLNVAENKSYAARDVIVTISNEEAGVSVPVSIHQKYTATFKADKTFIDVDMNGSTVTVNIESNISYEVNIPDDCDWITRPSSTRQSGATRAAGTSEVVLRVKENTTYKEREAVITITNKEAVEKGACEPIKITIHQPFTTTFKADNTAFNVDMAGETVTINMESNISYDVTIPSDCDWITRPTNSRNTGATRAINTSVIVLRVKENTSYKNRDAVITISNEQALKNGAIKEPIKIYINQPFTTTLNVNKPELEVPMEGSTVSVNVESNVPYNVNIPCDWITLVSGSRTRATKTSVVTFRVNANTSEQDRTATVTIKNTYGDEVVSVNISQKFSTVFNVDESPIEIDELGGTREITVAANVDIIVLPQVDWLKVGEKKAGGKGYWTQQIIVSALKNKVAKREGAVKFLHAPTNQSFNVKVTQNRLLYITEQEITLTEGDGPQKPTLNNPNAMEVTWSTSNTAVATVNSTGMVTAVKAGTAEITVTSADKKYTDKVKVTVIKKEAEE